MIYVVWDLFPFNGEPRTRYDGAYEENRRKLRLPEVVSLPANLLVDEIDPDIVCEYLREKHGHYVLTWKRQYVPYDLYEMIHELLYCARYSIDQPMAVEIQKLFDLSKSYELGPST